MARGFCTCKRDFPGRLTFHPAPGAAWHYLCDKPVAPSQPLIPAEPGKDGQVMVWRGQGFVWEDPPSRIVPTGTGWPVT